MGRKRKTRWRRLSIGEISANEDEDGEIGVAVISLTRSHSASQNHSPARSDKPLSGVITMTNNNKDSSSSSPSLHNSSTNLSTPAGSGGNNGGGPTGSTSSPANSKILSSDPSMTQTNSEKPPQNSLTPSSSSSPNPNSQSNSGYHNSHNHVPSSYHNSSHHPPHSVSSNESGCGSTSSSTGGGGGGSGTGHYNDRYHYTRENYRPPHHHHHHHNQHHSSHHNSNYNGSSSAPYQGGGESGGGGGSGSSRGERGSSYHYSGNPHGHKEYQNGYHGSGHYSGYQGGSTYYRNSHNNYRNAHYNSGGSSGGTGGGGEPYNGGESEGYHYPPSSRPYGGRFRKSRSYTASSYYYTNGSSKTSGGASNNTTDNINRPSYNQDEYTKITTPRQDVLFKKGYLSQKKTQPSSSVDSASAATTPSASTNGTPDTQSTNGINSDNSEGYDNDNQTDYVIPSTYDDTIYYAPPPEAMFTDPNTGQVYYGHCSTSGEYYDAYPVSPVMVATGYPPVYYPMVPYTPIDWNGVPAPMYPMVAAPAPPAPLVPTEDSSLISPGLQGLESSPATTTNPNTNSDTTSSSCTSSSSSAAAAGGAVATSITTSTPPAAPSSTSNTTTPSIHSTAAVATTTATLKTTTSVDDGEAEDEEEEEEEAHAACGDGRNNKEGLGFDSGLDSGSSVGDDTGSAATSQGNSSEEECVGRVGVDGLTNKVDDSKNTVRSKKQSKPNGNSSNSCSASDIKKLSDKKIGTNAEDNNNEESKLVEAVDKLQLSKDKDEYSSSESVLSSASSTASGKATPPTIKSGLVSNPDDSSSSSASLKAPVETLSLSPNPHTNNNSSGMMAVNNGTAIAPAPMKGIATMVISSQHPQHLTTTAITYNTTGGPHPQAIPVAGAPVMTTVPVPMGCPPVMIAAAPSGMPLPPLVPTAPVHHMTHPSQHQPPPPPQHGCPGQQHIHHQGHHHGGAGPHHSHLPHHNHHHAHHHPSHPHPLHPPNHHHHPHSTQGPPPPHHHSNYSHHQNHHHNPRHHGPPHHHPQHHQQQAHQNSPHHQQQPHHHMPPPPPPSAAQPHSQTAPPNAQPPPPPQVAGPPGSTPYHVYPHPTAYVYGPPVYNAPIKRYGPLTDEASTTTANTETCANLSDTTITTTENSKGADDLTIKEQLREESSELSTTQKNCDKNKSWETSPREIGEDGESYGEKSSTQAVTSEEKTTPSTTTTKVETTMVTGSETGQVKKQSCDSKLGNNIISSKEFTPVKPATTTAEGADSVGKVNALPLLSPSPLSFSSVDGVRTATASLTLESLDKMNKEIEIRPLKQEMSGAELTEKVDSQRIDFTTTTTSGVLTPPQPLPARTTSKSTQDEGEESASPAKVTQGDLKAAETLFTSSFLPSTSTSSSSCPSSANESSTSSPINGSTSLMRFQPKSATSKNLANEDDDKSITNHMEKSEQESCSSGGKPSNSNNNSKKKQKRNHTPSLSNGNQESHKSSKIGVDVKDEVNLLKKHQKGNSKGYQEKAGDNGEENNKSVSSDDTNENGEASQNHTASTQESGQSEQESCSQETAAAQSPQANVGEGDTPTVTPSLPKSSSSGLSRKPVDLTVQCPAANGNDDGHYETLQLQRSPSLANEPSSPDSLNTNQSVAGSEFAPGENLSVSESDLLNRTTSIDEVEEDLPQEVEYAVGGDEGAAEVRWSSTATADEDESTKQSCEITSSSSANQITAIKLPESENGTNAFTPSHEEFATTATKTTEGDLVNVGHNVRDGPCSSGGWESGEKSNDVTTEEVAAAVEEPIKSARTTTGAATTPTSQSSCNSGVQESGVEGEEGREAPLRPQSITLAVTEWLKTQGEDALTPIIARASSSDEFEGDVEETSDDEDYDENDDIDEENRVQSRGGDENASNLDQNQKNASGQPCLVAPSNKSGSSTSNKVTSRRRSGTKKSESKAKNDGSRFSGLPLKDGVCRVAPQFSSASAFNTTTTKTLNGAKALLEHNCKTSNRNINNSIKTKNSNALVSISSTCTSDDQDESYATDSNNKRKHSKQQNYNFKNSKTPVKVPSPPPITDSDKVGGEISGSTDISSMKNKIEDETAFYELGKDYDSGLELSSPENSSSSSVSRNFSSNALTLNANNKAKDSVNASTSWTTTSSPSTVSLPTSSACFDASICGSSSLRESSKRNKRPTLPKLAIDNITNKSLYSKYISPNSDHIVIAAPLSIIPLDSSADAPGAGESRRKNEKEQEISELSSSSVSLSQNNCMSTSPSLPSSPLNNTDVAGIVVQSPGSVPSTSTSMDERDHAEICDPQKYAKYYQFGVVFDTSDDPDQGIDTAAEEEEDGRESDSLDDVTLDSPPLPPPPNSLPNKNASVLSSEAVTSATDKDNGNSCEQKQGPHHCHRPQQKNPNDFLAFMQQRNRNLARKIKKSGDEKHNRDDVLVSKSIYHQEEDEEIGTFDPKAILERRLRRGSSNTVDTGDIALGEAASDEGSRYDADMDSVNNAPAASAIVCSLSEPPPLSMSHLYVNPLSLAAEMSGSENLNVGNDSQERKKKIAINEDDSSSFDSSSSDEPPLPPYESPPSIEIPVYNANTPSARVIRQNLYPIGDPVSGAICCSIQ